MVLVPVALALPNGPPTELQLKTRPALKGVVVCQFIVAICRLVVGDIWGCISDILVVVLGKWACTENSVEHVLWYGILCFFNGLFDTIRVVIRLFKYKMGYFDSEKEFLFNLASFAVLGAAILASIGAAMCYVIYKDYERQYGYGETAPFAPNSYNYGGPQGYYAQRPPADTYTPPARNQQFSAFQGAGHRLDGGPTDPVEAQYLPPPPRTGNDRRLF